MFEDILATGYSLFMDDTEAPQPEQAQQLYAPGIPFVPHDTVPLMPISDDDADALERGEIVVTWYGDRGVMSRAELRAMYEACDV